MFKEFMAFLKEYGVLALAVAVIIGGKLNLLVTSLVNDLLTPLLFQPALEAAGVKNIAELSYNGILYGKVIAALIDFLVVAFLVFLIAKKVMKEQTVAKK
ncbi:MscL family protein [Peredibacter sp. HCB2-198]|uniref:large conductance mechanosensitive channel protein MscL n=1 Tax=Peredibacter sp. HCB2-198 TaxID=3383025 RepID=UPI0038B6163B